MKRRTVLIGLGAACLSACSESAPTTATPNSFDVDGFEAAMKALESKHMGSVGVTALALRTGQTLSWRGDTRFAYCSVFKWVLAAACLKAANEGRLKMDQVVTFGPKDIIGHSPVIEKNLKIGHLTVAELCAGTVITSDNAAANLLTPLIGGLEGLRAFVAHYGDEVMRFDRMEPELNTNLPDDPRDTTTPEAMSKLLYSVLNLDGLSTTAKETLRGWMMACETGDKRIRAGVPTGWKIGDKTGTSENGAANDVAFFSSPLHGEIYLSVFTNRTELDMDKSGAMIADVTREIINRLLPKI